MFKRKFLRLARTGKGAVVKDIGSRREYLSAVSKNRESWEPARGRGFGPGFGIRDSGFGICRSQSIARERAPADRTAR
jgi:hypothetical protein